MANITPPSRYILSGELMQKWLKNVLLFFAPALAVFFYQLSQGVELKLALGVAGLALWGILFDYFRKLK